MSVFPSLTPVCLSSIATGAHPDVHEIPHLVWWHRGERRLVEYGSSFGAARAAGLGRTLRDTLVGMNAEHLGRGATTVFEALADAGLRTAAVNFTAYRGRTRHRAGGARSSATSAGRSGSSSTTSSSRSAPARRSRGATAPPGRSTRTRPPSGAGSSPATPSTSSSSTSPTTTSPPTRPGPMPRTSARALRRRARRSRCAPPAVSTSCSTGTRDRVVSDHGQTRCRQVARLRDSASARARDACGRVQPRRARLPARRCRADGARPRRGGSTASRPSTWRCSARTGRRRAARRRGAAVRDAGPASASTATRRSSTTPTGLPRDRTRFDARTPASCSCRRRRAGSSTDLGGRHHRGGGSHGSLLAGDSEVPVLCRRRRSGSARHRRRRPGHPAPLRRRPTALRDAARRVTGRRARLEARRARDGGAPAPPSRDRRPARARGDGSRAARALRAASSSSTRRTRTARCRSATGRRSRSRSSSQRCASCSQLRGDERVLDVGTGSGYAAAVLAELAAEVVSIERLPALAEQARRALDDGPSTTSRCGSETAPAARPTARRSRRSPSPRRPRRPARRSSSSWPKAAGSSCRAAAAPPSVSCSSCAPRRVSSSRRRCPAASSRSSVPRASATRVAPERPLPSAGQMDDVRSPTGHATSPAAGSPRPSAAGQLGAAGEVLRRRRHGLRRQPRSSTRCSCAGSTCTTSRPRSARSSSR